ncbi:MAG: hypothetical protein SOT67_03825 [Bacteroidaceae bacterium]|nr:hypothetical protein [Prevotellaceae bacterium]MDY2849378.1 hypothetical protein [Bacteroidaceae bacterium]
MKKPYNSPLLEVITLQNSTNICTTSIAVGREDQSGAEQLSKKFWGTSVFDDAEPTDDEGI